MINNNIKILLMIGFCMLWSCKKDDNGVDGGSGYVMLEGKRYGMKTATYTDIDVAGQQAVTLTIDNDHSARRHLNISFQEKLFAELTSGTYTLKAYPWPNADGSYKPNQHFAAAGFVFDCAGMAIESCQETSVTSGTLTIQKSGGNITIALEGMTLEGAIEVHYDGVIKNLLDIGF